MILNKSMSNELDIIFQVLAPLLFGLFGRAMHCVFDGDVIIDDVTVEYTMHYTKVYTTSETRSRCSRIDFL